MSSIYPFKEKCPRRGGYPVFGSVVQVGVDRDACVRHDRDDDDEDHDHGR